MCGLAGVLNLDGRPVSSALLTRMGEAIRHRGPDGSGLYTDRGLGLVHQRLAIIDLSPAAAQPMVSADDRFVIAYNGEIYNFGDLRKELCGRGHTFRSRSDSEVALAAFAEWGENAIGRFNGMFAVAWWDRQRAALTLARDRYGIKPLYYTVRANSVTFGSEVKALLQDPGVAARMDPDALVEYLTFQNLFTDRTLFEGIRLLPAGSWIRFGPGAPPAAPTRYWDFHFSEPEAPRREEEYLEELDVLFRQAVTRQLVSDVEVGAYLSGGIDSGSITAVAATELPYIRTFTTGFDLTSASGVELSFDERSAAEYMSYLFKTEHYEMVLKAGDMERVLPKLVWHLEEPRVGQSYPNFYAAQLASRFCKVVLSGTGGDEVFGGYPWRYYRAAVNDDFEHYIDKYYAFWQRLLPARSVEEVCSPMGGAARNVSTRDIFRSVFQLREPEVGRPEDYINHSLYFEAKTFLHSLLIVEDKLSMAHGLETRVPFLDNDLVDFAMRLPVRLKLGNLGSVVALNENEPGPKTARYFAKTKDGKLLLRRAMSKYVPPNVTERAKQGFSAPDASWFKGESIDYVRRVIFDDRARIYEYLDRASVRQLVNLHLEGKENRRLLIWSLLSLDKFCETFL